MFRLATAAASGALVFATACATDLPTVPEANVAAPSMASGRGDAATPNFNLEVVLRSATGDGAFGLVKFRQPKDDSYRINLDTWIRGLAPDTDYYLERATDAGVDDDCTSSGWLTLGHGTVVVPITTDAVGTGRGELFRILPAALDGTEFDIHFRVRDGLGNVVLESACYQFVVSR